MMANLLCIGLLLSISSEQLKVPTEEGWKGIEDKEPALEEPSLNEVSENKETMMASV